MPEITTKIAFDGNDINVNVMYDYDPDEDVLTGEPIMFYEILNVVHDDHDIAPMIDVSNPAYDAIYKAIKAEEAAIDLDFRAVAAGF